MAERQQPESTGRQQQQGTEAQAQREQRERQERERQQQGGERNAREGIEGQGRQDTGGYGREGAETRQVSARPDGTGDVRGVPDDQTEQFEGSERPDSGRQGGQRRQ